MIGKKGDGGFKILQKEIGGIHIYVEIFQNNFSNIRIFESPKLHLGQKKN